MNINAFLDQYYRGASENFTSTVRANSMMLLYA